MLDHLFPEWVQPVVIPPTTKERYLSFYQALNLRRLTEVTGDWHYCHFFYCTADRPPVPVVLAGEGMAVNTNPSLGTLGIRNMADELVEKKIILPTNNPVWTANHFRAIADLALREIGFPYQRWIITVNEVNQWLDTKKQVDELVANYLAPLRQQKKGRDRAVYEEWLQTIRFQ